MNFDNIETESCPDFLTTSFNVDIKYDNKSKGVSENFWPQGIGCRFWQPKFRQNKEGQLVPPGIVGNQY